MKRFNYYLSLMLLLVFTAACNDEFDQPPMVIPTAEHTPNMTIAEFKAKYWQDAVNYIDTVKEDIVIHGWVTSSDESGNIYKSLYIMDESGAGINISINQNSLYNNYRLGQEIVIPMKDYFVGKYNGQQQLGYPAWYASGSVWEATFLPQAMWESMVELNGLPNLSKIDTLDVSISDFQGKTDAETLLKYQGRLVRISGVHFTEANGKTTYAEASATTNRTIADEDGNQLIVRNSNYADFRADTLPEGDVDVVGLLSFYATRQNSSGTWQFYLRDAHDVIGGGGKGTHSNPYTTVEAVEAQNSGAKGWVTGYIVGAVGPEVTTVSGNADIEWKAPTTLDNTIVIADDPNCTDINRCIIIPLPQGSKAREELSLKAYPALTETGAIGCYSDSKAPAQYYTQEDIKEIVAYASERFIEVIPEIDMPGHFGAAARSLPGIQGGDGTLNPASEETYTVLGAVIRELSMLFPGRWFHIGGDEVHSKAWPSIPEVAELMVREHLETVPEVQGWFGRRIADTVRFYGKTIAGWDDIAEYGLSSDQALVMWWQARRPGDLDRDVAAGYPTVICPERPFYLDYFGMMDNAKYAKRNIIKLDDYYIQRAKDYIVERYLNKKR